MTTIEKLFKKVCKKFCKFFAQKSKKYMYVEATHKDINGGKEFVGLFRGGYPVGRGHCMGWYGAEYLRFTRCLAVNKDYCSKFLPQIPISTMLRIESFYAENNKEARQKFIQIISRI